MFTGLVTAVGTLERVGQTAAGRELVVRGAHDDLAGGESVAVDGVCLTVRECGAGWFSAAAVSTTLGRTTLEGWRAGRRVNLERALRASDRFGGHLVQGHVDAVAEVLALARQEDSWLVDLGIPRELAPLMVPHGSIAVNGVSLTVNELLSDDVVQLSLIEYTLRHTNLGTLVPGDEVNVEADLIGKFVQRLLFPYAARAELAR